MTASLTSETSVGVANETGGISTSIVDTKNDDEVSNQWAVSVDSLSTGSDISQLAGGCSRASKRRLMTHVAPAAKHDHGVFVQDTYREKKKVAGLCKT